MAGYRDRSTFDPNATPSLGRPLRPFNGVQWMGVGMMVVGFAMYLFYFAGRFGLMKELLNSPIIGTTTMILGVTLINTRRQELIDPAPELAAARRRWLIIVVAICALILGIATAFTFQGAH
jgi:hypothetical protein